MDFGRDEEERKREQAVARERAKGEAGASLIEHMRLVGKLDGLREQQTLQKQLQLAVMRAQNWTRTECVLAKRDQSDQHNRVPPTSQESPARSIQPRSR